MLNQNRVPLVSRKRRNLQEGGEAQHHPSTSYTTLKLDSSKILIRNSEILSFYPLRT